MLRFSLLFTFAAFCAEMPGQSFSEVAVQMGVNYECESFQELGGGMAWFDYDNDGYQDLYLCGGQLQDRLYHNNAGSSFSDVSDQVNLFETSIRNTTGVVAGDLDNDGFTDFLVTTWNAGFGVVYQRNLLYRNNGIGGFVEVGLSAGLSDLKLGMPCTFIDANHDTYLDIYVGNYLEESGLLYDEYDNVVGFAHICFEDDLYLNDGNWGFTKVESEFWPGNDGCTLALMPTDANRDGLADLMVANDFGEWVVPNRQFVATADSTPWEDIAPSNGADIQLYGMGIASADYDLDQDLDYYVTNLGDNALLRQEADGTFSEVAADAGVQDGIIPGVGKSVGWGTFFFDFDNSRYPDLFVANGYIPAISWLSNPFAQEDRLFRNLGGGAFTDVTADMLETNAWRSRGAACADFNRDGRVDFGVTALLNGLDFPTPRFRLQANQTAGGNFVAFDLEGITCNRDAYGTQVEVYTPLGVQLGEVQSGSSHMSQNASTVHFGLGAVTEIDSVKIHWPLGNVQLLDSVLINAYYDILQDTSTYVPEEPVDTTDTDEEYINWIISLPAGEGVERIDVKKNLWLEGHTHSLERTLEVFPNPVEDVVGLTFKLDAPTPLTIEVLDASGRVVRTLWAGSRSEGRHELQLLRPQDLAAGSYFLRLRAADAIAVRRLHLVGG